MNRIQVEEDIYPMRFRFQGRFGNLVGHLSILRYVGPVSIQDDSKCAHQSVLIYIINFMLLIPLTGTLAELAASPGLWRIWAPTEARTHSRERSLLLPAG